MPFFCPTWDIELVRFDFVVLDAAGALREAADENDFGATTFEVDRGGR